MTTFYKEEVLDRAETQVINFGIKDDQGRECDLIIKCATVAFTVNEDPNCCWGFSKPYPPYRLDAQAARNGKQFGAAQRDSYFETVEKRDAAIAKRIKETKARYAKKFG